MSTQPSINVVALWKYVSDHMKNQITLPSLWRALEAAVPLTIENDEFIIGFAGEAAPQAGILQNNQYRNMLEQVIEAATRRRLKLRFISGDTLDDWEAEKARVLEAQKLQIQSRQRLQQEIEAGNTWDAVGESLIRKLANLQGRAFPSVQGRFLEEVIATLAEAYGRLMPENPAENDERSYSRSLDRLSERLGVPATFIAYQVYLRRKG